MTDFGNVGKILIVAGAGLALLGALLELGPGGLVLQGGYQHGRIDETDLELLAGGLVIEAGYRLVCRVQGEDALP